MTEKAHVHSKSLFLRPKKLKGVLERVNQEMYLRNLELAQTNRTLSLLRTIDKIVLEAQGTIDDLCNEITHEIAKATNYPLVTILAQERRNKGEMKISGWDSLVPVGNKREDFVYCLEANEDQREWLQSTQLSMNMSLASMAKGRLTKRSKDGISVAESMGIKSVYVVKLTARGHLVGLMVVGLMSDTLTSGISSNDQDLINRLGSAVGIALDNKLLLEENARVLKQLQKSNDKLKALDQIKNEFLSMASHQLRTPLTSIKGYVSMVLEGDAGSLTTQQHKLLQESFNSSERMVRLISDFLNVSRLQTGKFAIEKTSFNLKEVVKQEVSNLEIIAGSHDIKLKLKVADGNYPIIADESKIRQVIMNFVDNAIYYSHPSSTIIVNLEKIKDQAALTVVDTGIGVPKDEQAKLFTKFFRAQNARKQRPDGTGVGLFLAQRVISAHKGSIIFSSTEGQGSTFGFKLPLMSHH